MPKVSFGGLFSLCRPKWDHEDPPPLCYSSGTISMSSALMAVQEINNKTDTFHDDVLKNHVVSLTTLHCTPVPRTCMSMPERPI